MKVRMLPGRDSFGQPNGVSRVIEKYYQHGMEAGIEFVDDDSYDISAVHAGMTRDKCDVSILHGIYFTGDYAASNHEFGANDDIVAAVRSAKAITVPSRWVSEIIQRDLHINPFVVPHGIDIGEWDHNYPFQPYILYNKNRDGFDVCNSEQLDKLASRFPHVQFVSTFSKSQPPNIKVIGVQPHQKMRMIVQQSMVYLSLTKETFGIGILEAMASGVPVLGWDYGGNSEIVKHGVNGYLAIPGNYDDLAEGLKYCTTYRKVLGENSREIAKTFTWKHAVECLRDAFDFAYTQANQEPNVSVIIPVYNYANKIERAVKSVQNQIKKASEIIIVDDGSTDNIKEVVDELQVSDKSIKFITKRNGGVSTARNLGASYATSKYICFLDADDALDPRFLDICVESLEENNSLHLAYTGLQWIDQEGKTGLSKWPGQWDFDSQIRRKNQVPTCNVMRRSSFIRAGGYRQRYAPYGAGTEDAELWTRFGEYGMRCSQVTDEGLFTYSVSTGNTSKPYYREMDWLDVHPYIQGSKPHPFASYASVKTKKRSHPVYQYDEPIISVIIPVGEGHEYTVLDALDSVQGQTFNKHETIVVWDSDKPTEFDGINLLDAYPYIRLFKTPHHHSGPGVARNIGVKESRGSFVVFLDADDYLDPFYMERTLVEWNEHQGIIYTDYVGISTLDPERIDEFRARLIDFDTKTHSAKIAYNAAEYDCQLAQQQPTRDLFHWCLVTCLIPKAWHSDIGGFDENMKSWEDVDYHWRMAKAGYCYYRLDQRLVYYRFDTGKRRSLASSDENKGKAQELLQYMKDKYERIKIMACSTCGQKRAYNPSVMVNQTNTPDDEYVMAIYTSQNKGDHPVYGAATGKYYGYRVGGDRFLVHRDDIARAPHLFNKIEIAPKEIPVVEEKRTDLQEPQRIVSINPNAAHKVDEIISIEENKNASNKFDINAVPGISPVVGRYLSEELNVDSWESLYKITLDDLKKIKTVGESRANMILNSIARIKNARESK